MLFDELRAAWGSAGPAGRQALEARLARFAERFPSEPAARQVAVYRAWNALEAQELELARARLVGVLSGPPGAPRDEATIIAAALSLAEGNPHQALRQLAPLAGKLVDSELSMEHAELHVRAAIAARRWTEAIGATRDWLSGSPAHLEPEARSKVLRLLAEVPREVQFRQWVRLGKGASRFLLPARRREENWLRSNLLELLARGALERHDPLLARRLIEEAIDLRFTPRGAALVELANEAGLAPRIGIRTVGLVLSVNTPERRLRSAQLVEGLEAALRQASENPGGAPPVTLLVEEAKRDADLPVAFNSLMGRGAQMLVAGVDMGSARVALRASSSSSAPLFLAAWPGKSPAPEGSAFLMGADPGPLLALLETRLPQLGAQDPWRIDSDSPCPTSWSRPGTDLLVLLGPAACSRRLLALARSVPAAPAIVLGLESATLPLPDHWPAASYVLSAGAFPGTVQPGSTVEEDRAAAVGLSWYQAIGLDTGRLMMSALAELPVMGAENPQAVRRLHHMAQRAVARSESDLLTSAARGFEGGRLLRRQFELVPGGRGTSPTGASDE